MVKTITKKKSSTLGKKFKANSKGKPATWIVYDRVKDGNTNLICCRVMRGKGIPAKRNYTPAQFSMLLRNKIIKFI